MPALLLASPISAYQAARWGAADGVRRQQAGRLEREAGRLERAADRLRPAANAAADPFDGRSVEHSTAMAVLRLRTAAQAHGVVADQVALVPAAARPAEGSTPGAAAPAGTGALRRVALRLRGSYRGYKAFHGYLHCLDGLPAALVALRAQGRGFEVVFEVYGR